MNTLRYGIIQILIGINLPPWGTDMFTSSYVVSDNTLYSPDDIQNMVACKLWLQFNVIIVLFKNYKVY